MVWIASNFVRESAGHVIGRVDALLPGADRLRGTIQKSSEDRLTCPQQGAGFLDTVAAVRRGLEIEPNISAGKMLVKRLTLFENGHEFLEPFDDARADG